MDYSRIDMLDNENAVISALISLCKKREKQRQYKSAPNLDTEIYKALGL